MPLTRTFRGLAAGKQPISVRLLAVGEDRYLLDRVC
jgi:hypothetical protein